MKPPFSYTCPGCYHRHENKMVFGCKCGYYKCIPNRDDSIKNEKPGN